MLIEPANLPSELCKSPMSWVLGETAAVRAEWPMLVQAPAQAKVKSLRRVEARVLDFPGMPNAGSADK